MRTRLEVHHVVKRAQRTSDFDLDRLVALCPPCHAQTDAPYACGRLVIIPLCEGHFTAGVRLGRPHGPVPRYRFLNKLRRPLQRALGRPPADGVRVLD